VELCLYSAFMPSWHGQGQLLPIALISICAFLIQGEQNVCVHLCENVALQFWKWGIVSGIT
jgi:hypothetical protein